MNTLKYILLSLISLVLIFAGYGYFQDKEVSVSRSIVINAPMDDVFDQFNNIEKRVKWSPWEAMDSTMVVTVGEVSKGSGASYSWTSENSGNGTIIYKEVVPNQLIESKLYFGSMEEEPSQGLMIFTEVGDGSQVTWEVHMDMGNNPFMRIFGRFMDDMVGTTFENGLEAVKQVCETNAKETADKMASIEIIKSEVESKPYIGILDSCAMDELGNRIANNYGALGAYLGEHSLQPAGFVRIIYHTYEPPSKVVFEPLFIISNPISVTDDRIHASSTYGGKVITATHIGSYETSGMVWEAMDAYLKNHNLEMNGMPWEEYENTPRDEPDPNKLITHIYMPIK
tara:strand:- start:91789 stop:92811 length:1023 start_codon:yes stop_codon:yes gene_type:complete